MSQLQAGWQTRRYALLRASASGLVLLTLARPADATERLRIRGQSRISAHAIRESISDAGLQLILRGTLTDDASTPLAGQRVVVRVRNVRGAEALGGSARKGPAFARPSPCMAADAPHAHAAPELAATGRELAVFTDDAGRFCLRTTVTSHPFALTCAFAPSSSAALIEGIEEELIVDASRRSLALHVDPTPFRVSLDAESSSLDISAIYTDNSSGEPARDLPLAITVDNTVLDHVLTNAAGRAHLEIPTSKLGLAGLGELQVRFEGNATTDAASVTTNLERHARVDWVPPPSPLERQESDDELALSVNLRTRAGPVDEGIVEARRDGTLVGSAPVRGGRAALRVRPGAGDDEKIFVRLRYVPSSSWLESESEPTVELHVRSGPSRARLPLFVSGAAVFVLFVMLRRASRVQPPVAPQSSPALDGVPRVESLKPKGSSRSSDWTGVVLDAHEGRPLANARVWIEQGTFGGSEVLAETNTSKDGTFHLPELGRTFGDIRLVAQGTLHKRLVQPLPPPGALRITLISYRRALLADLVRWARQRGAPYDALPEATPGHVRRAARNEPAAARWATALERAAFGPQNLDAETAEQISALEPNHEAGIVKTDPAEPGENGAR